MGFRFHPGLKWVLLVVSLSGCGDKGTKPDTDDRVMQRSVTRDVTARNPCWSPDGRHIAFSSSRTGHWAIWTIDVQDSVLLQVTPDSLQATDCGWSPDSRSLAFTSFARGQGDIWVIPDTTGTAVRITDTPASDSGPAWSPDGNSIAYVSTFIAGDSSCLVVTPLHGGNPQTVFGVAGTMDRPSWYPDGTRLTGSYPVTGKSHRDVYIASFATGVTRITTGGYYYEASLSHDGTRLAFAGFHEDITVMDAAGGNTRSRTYYFGRPYFHSPAWSPDGKRIVFSAANDDHDYGIFVIDS